MDLVLVLISTLLLAHESALCSGDFQSSQSILINCTAYEGTSAVLHYVMQNSKYDNLSRPFLEDGVPVQIQVQFRLNHLYNVDALANTFQTDVFTRFHWTDPRLAFNVCV